MVSDDPAQLEVRDRFSERAGGLGGRSKEAVPGPCVALPERRVVSQLGMDVLVGSTLEAPQGARACIPAGRIVSPRPPSHGAVACARRGAGVP